MLEDVNTVHISYLVTQVSKQTCHLFLGAIITSTKHCKTELADFMSWFQLFSGFFAIAKIRRSVTKVCCVGAVGQRCRIRYYIRNGILDYIYILLLRITNTAWTIKKPVNIITVEIVNFEVKFL